MLRKTAASVVTLAALAGFAQAGPADIALQPSPQEFTNTCQSYSMGLAMAFHPASPYKADTPVELRDLERRLRDAITANAAAHNRTEIMQEDWRAAMLAVSSGTLRLAYKTFGDLDSAMRFVGITTGITTPDTLGTTLSIVLVKTPVLMSFHKIGGSDYRGAAGTGSHVVTIFGVQLPPATMTDAAKPRLLLVNSAVKYKGGVKNICNATDLSDRDRYTALATYTADYTMKRFDNTAPFIVHYIENNQ